MFEKEFKKMWKKDFGTSNWLVSPDKYLRSIRTQIEEARTEERERIAEWAREKAEPAMCFDGTTDPEMKTVDLDTLLTRLSNPEKI